MKPKPFFLFLVICSLVLAGLVCFVNGSSVWESCDVTATSVITVVGVNWEAQTFTVGSVAHTVSEVDLYCYKVGSPVGNLNLGIRATSSGKPSGQDLVNVSVLVSSLSNSHSWQSWNFSSPYTLSANTVYAVVFSLPDGVVPNDVVFYYNASNPYTGGGRSASGNSGSTWSAPSATADYLFKVWGDYLYPQFNNVGQSSTVSASSSLMYVNWSQTNSSEQLSYFRFCWNDSGSFVNDSWVEFSAPNVAWANVTHTISAVLGSVVQWFDYVNCTDGYEYGAMTRQNFTATVVVQYHISGNGDLLLNGTYTHDNTNTTYSASTVVQLDACPKNASYIFSNFTWNFGSSLDNRYNQTIVNNQSSVLWCYFESVSAGVSFIYARFTMNNTAPYQNQDTVFFNASLSNCSNLPLAYYWEFGDSNTSTGETTTHIYLNSGVFIVNLTVVNGAMSDTMLQNITVFATSINITFDWNDLLFGSGAWLPFIAIIIAMFVGVAINKWFIVAAFPIMALMSFLYFDHITTTPALVWEALIMICSAIVLLLYSASKK